MSARPAWYDPASLLSLPSTGHTRFWNCKSEQNVCSHSQDPPLLKVRQQRHLYTRNLFDHKLNWQALQSCAGSREDCKELHSVTSSLDCSTPSDSSRNSTWWIWYTGLTTSRSFWYDSFSRWVELKAWWRRHLLKNASAFSKPIWFGATGVSKKAPTFFLVLAIDISDRDCSLAINTLMELEVSWKKRNDPWRSISQNAGKFWEASGVLVKALLFSSNCKILAGRDRGLPTPNSSVMADGTSLNIGGRMISST